MKNIIEYLKSEDPELVNIGVELLNSQEGLDKKSILKESGFNNMQTTYWWKNYRNHRLLEYILEDNILRIYGDIPEESFG